MKLKNLLFVIALFAAFTFSACEDDEGDSKPAYVGNWQTEPYASPADPTGNTMNKTTFEFTETTFQAEIFLIAGTVSVPVVGVKGSLEDLGENSLHASITDAGQYVGNDYEWKNRTDDPAEFNALYNTYLSSAIPLDFDADYVIDGSDMDFIIPAAQDTLELSKL